MKPSYLVGYFSPLWSSVELKLWLVGFVDLRYLLKCPVHVIPMIFVNNLLLIDMTLHFSLIFISKITIFFCTQKCNYQLTIQSSNESLRTQLSKTYKSFEDMSKRLETPIKFTSSMLQKTKASV